MIYAISTLNDSPGQRTGYQVFGSGENREEAMEDAIDHIGGRDMPKSMIEQTYYRNLQFVTKNQLAQYGIRR